VTEPQDPYRGQQPPGDQPQYGSQPQYGQPQYGGQPPQYGEQPYPQSPSYGSSPGGPGDGGGHRNGMGIAALILGILGLLTSWLLFGGLFGLLAIVLGFVGLGRVRRGEASNRGMAITGIVLGLLSVAVAVLIGALVGAVWDRVQDCADPNLTQAEQEQCVNDRL